MPGVSVIVPLYNKGPYVERAVESVLAQEYGDFELVIVDDGSTDDGPDRVRRFTDPRVRLVSQPNGGPGSARNKGLSLSQSDLVVCLDADDEYLPGFLHTTTQFMEEHSECACVTTGFYLHPGNRSSEAWCNEVGLSDGVHVLEPHTDSMFASMLIAHMNPWATLCRKEVLLQFGGFFDQYRCLWGEDQFLFIKVAINNPVGMIMQPHLVHDSAASDTEYNLTSPREIEPFLTDPSPLYDVCPPEKRKLLEGVLEVRAVWSAHRYSQLLDPPDYKKARLLLSRFPAMGAVDRGTRRRVELWARAPWLAKILRRAKQPLGNLPKRTRT